MNRQTLLHFFSIYITPYLEEKSFIPQFNELLIQQTCFERTHLPGHITGSAWIVDSARTHVLLVHHAKLNKWLQPGGHADGDEHVLRVALREAEEETGLKDLTVISETPFDVDIHLIPARKELAEHFHFDIRFLIEANPEEKIIVSDESHDVKWIPLNNLEDWNSEQSILRMKQKLLRTN
ncbi:MAG: NUDIX hydrolase [Cyclobacteriaceae bacterium]|nr:NUDIX hydrolase [Cyclobacteriaceae bacterium]